MRERLRPKNTWEATIDLERDLERYREDIEKDLEKPSLLSPILRG